MPLDVWEAEGLMVELHNPAQAALDSLKAMLADAEAAGDTDRARDLRTELARLEHEWAQMEARIRENGDVEGVNALLHFLEKTTPTHEGEAATDTTLRRMQRLKEMEPIDDATPRNDD